MLVGISEDGKILKQELLYATNEQPNYGNSISNLKVNGAACRAYVQVLQPGCNQWVLPCYVYVLGYNLTGEVAINGAVLCAGVTTSLVRLQSMVLPCVRISTEIN